jgi:hypothetical protein
MLNNIQKRKEQSKKCLQLTAYITLYVSVLTFIELKIESKKMYVLLLAKNNEK